MWTDVGACVHAVANNSTARIKGTGNEGVGHFLVDPMMMEAATATATAAANVAEEAKATADEESVARMKEWMKKFEENLDAEGAAGAAYEATKEMSIDIAKKRMMEMSQPQRDALLMCESMRCCERVLHGRSVDCEDWCDIPGNCWSYLADDYLALKARADDRRGLAKGLMRWMKINAAAEPTKFAMGPNKIAAIKAVRFIAKPYKYYFKHLAPMVEQQVKWWRNGPWMPSKVELEWAPCFCDKGGKDARCQCRYGAADEKTDWDTVESVCG